MSKTLNLLRHDHAQAAWSPDRTPWRREEAGLSRDRIMNLAEIDVRVTNSDDIDALGQLR